jgi:hypothetical protein
MAQIAEETNGVIGIFTRRQGYIGVPRGHPSHGLSAEDDDEYPCPQVHGGITYGEHGTDFRNGFTFPEDYWVFGWDYCHGITMEDLIAVRSYGTVYTPAMIRQDVINAMQELALMIVPPHAPVHVPIPANDDDEGDENDEGDESDEELVSTMDELVVDPIGEITESEEHYERFCGRDNVSQPGLTSPRGIS